MSISYCIWKMEMEMISSFFSIFVSRIYIYISRE